MLEFLQKHNYDPTEDYVTAHLNWIVVHKNFLPKEQSSLSGTETYLDIMKELYTTQQKSPYRNSYAFITYILDKKYNIEKDKIDKKLSKVVNELEPTPNGWWFVTIGFNHDTWNVKDCNKCIEKILQMEWIISGKANFELYRTNGEHPHVHFIIETKEPKSRILEKLFRPLYTKKVVFSKNFIDVKPMMEYHLKYIMLEKQIDKMENVEKDKEFRKKNNIPDYEKNFTTSKISI